MFSNKFNPDVLQNYNISKINRKKQKFIVTSLIKNINSL